ncbi:MAG: hypothetical protein ACD_31C00016G0001 [uncultured bacterium]|nr:MAG: hypothetical protein ACD_31C00016G0001 [uncultured bacterium]
MTFIGKRKNYFLKGGRKFINNLFHKFNLNLNVKKMVKITSIAGLIMGLMYLPGLPIYLLKNLNEGEIVIWSVLVLILSLILLLTAFIKILRRKLITVLILILLLILNLGAIYLYLDYLPDRVIGPSNYEQTSLASIKLIPHFIFIIIILLNLYFIGRHEQKVGNT